MVNFRQRQPNRRSRLRLSPSTISSHYRNAGRRPTTFMGSYWQQRACSKRSVRIDNMICPRSTVKDIRRDSRNRSNLRVPQTIRDTRNCWGVDRRAWLQNQCVYCTHCIEFKEKEKRERERRKIRRCKRDVSFNVSKNNLFKLRHENAKKLTLTINIEF